MFGTVTITKGTLNGSFPLVLTLTGSQPASIWCPFLITSLNMYVQGVTAARTFLFVYTRSSIFQSVKNTKNRLLTSSSQRTRPVTSCIRCGDVASADGMAGRWVRVAPVYSLVPTRPVWWALWYPVISRLPGQDSLHLSCGMSPGMTHILAAAAAACHTHSNNSSVVNNCGIESDEVACCIRNLMMKISVRFLFLFSMGVQY